MHKLARRIIIVLALVSAAAPLTGCTFGVRPHESLDPAYAAIPPCFTGDVCAGLQGISFWR